MTDNPFAPMFQREYPQPSSICSVGLSFAKHHHQPLECVSHGSAKGVVIQHPNDVCIGTGRTYYQFNSVKRFMTNATVRLYCTANDLNNLRTNIVWMSGDTYMATMPLPLIVLLNQTSTVLQSSMMTTTTAAAQLIPSAQRRYADTFRLLRLGLAFSKLVADTVLSFVALVDGIFAPSCIITPAKPRCPLEFRERLCAAGKNVLLQFHLNVALPIGAQFPTTPIFATQIVQLVDFDVDVYDRSAEISLQCVEFPEKRDFNREEEHMLLSFTDFFRLDKTATTTTTADRSAVEYVWRGGTLPTVAFALFFGGAGARMCPNVDTVEIYFRWPTPVTACSTILIEPNNLETNRCALHKIVYRVADCQVSNRFAGGGGNDGGSGGTEAGWLVLPIDRSLSLHDALHKSTFDQVPDYLDATRIKDPLIFRFASSDGSAIDMPAEIHACARQINCIRYSLGMCGKLYH